MTKDKNKSADNVHSGHRDRMRKKIEAGHIRTFADHEVLEVLLYNVVPRADTNPIAHNLLSTFGNLKTLLSSDKYKLASVSGVGIKVACYLETIGELYRRASLGEIKLTRLDTPAKLKDYIKNSFAFENSEKFIMICLDVNLKVLQCTTLALGDSASVKVSASDAVKSAILTGAKYVIFAHNHLNTSATPSKDDIETTKVLISKLLASGILVVDHVITNGESEFSLRNLEMFENCYRALGVNYDEIFMKGKLKDLVIKSSTPEENLLNFLYMPNK